MKDLGVTDAQHNTNFPEFPVPPSQSPPTPPLAADAALLAEAGLPLDEAQYPALVSNWVHPGTSRPLAGTDLSGQPALPSDRPDEPIWAKD